MSPSHGAVIGPGPVWPCLSAHGSGTLLSVSVAPSAKHTAADGLHDGCLRIRLAAQPVEGRANQALITWLAQQLGLPRRSVRLLRGENARRKQIELDITPEAAARWLTALMASLPTTRLGDLV